VGAGVARVIFTTSAKVDCGIANRVCTSVRVASRWSGFPAGGRDLHRGMRESLRSGVSTVREMPLRMMILVS